jgi:membrane protein implicated in regulation of membrane protease activity
VAWLIWVGVALVAAVAEVASLDFVLVMFAGGALASAVAAGAGSGVEVQVLVFAVFSTVLLLVARPPLLRWSRSAQGARTGVEALVGKMATVLEEVSGAGGRVKLAGEVWSARSAGGGRVFPEGASVAVLRIDGATAVVDAEPPPISASDQDA